MSLEEDRAAHRARKRAGNREMLALGMNLAGVGMAGMGKLAALGTEKKRDKQVANAMAEFQATGKLPEVSTMDAPAYRQFMNDAMAYRTSEAAIKQSEQATAASKASMARGASQEKREQEEYDWTKQHRPTEQEIAREKRQARRGSKLDLQRKKQVLELGEEEKKTKELQRKQSIFEHETDRALKESQTALARSGAKVNELKAKALKQQDARTLDIHTAFQNVLSQSRTPDAAFEVYKAVGGPTDTPSGKSAKANWELAEIQYGIQPEQIRARIASAESRVKAINEAAFRSIDDYKSQGIQLKSLDDAMKLGSELSLRGSIIDSDIYRSLVDAFTKQVAQADAEGWTAANRQRITGLLDQIKLQTAEEGLRGRLTLEGEAARWGYAAWPEPLERIIQQVATNPSEQTFAQMWTSIEQAMPGTQPMLISVFQASGGEDVPSVWVSMANELLNLQTPMYRRK